MVLVAFVIVITATVSACCVFVASPVAFRYLVTSPMPPKMSGSTTEVEQPAAIPSRLLSATFTSNWSHASVELLLPDWLVTFTTTLSVGMVQAAAAGVAMAIAGTITMKNAISQAGRRIPPGRRSLVLRHWKCALSLRDPTRRGERLMLCPPISEMLKRSGHPGIAVCN